MTRATKGRNTFNSSNTRYNVERFLAALVTPKTQLQLQAEVHLSARSIRHYLTHLRAEPNRRVYLKRYLLINGRYEAFFALGNKPDAVKPRQTPAEKAAKWKAKVKSDPELQQRLANFEKARWATRKATKQPNTWLSALI